MAQATGPVSDTTTNSPGGTGQTGRSEISFIEFNATTLKQLQIFLSKRPCSMMFFLLLNVITNRFQLRSSHGESSVSFLPGERLNAHLLMYPFGRN